MSTFHPLVVRSDEAEYLPSIGHRLLADSSATGGALSTHRITLGRGDGGAVPHRHDRSAELFFVVGGRLAVLVDDHIETAGEGDLVVVPPHTTHAFRATPDAPADALIVITPGVERFEYFHHVVRQRAGEQSPDVLAALQDVFDTHFVDSSAWTAPQS